MALTSPFANLHNALIERITLMVPEIRYIAQDMGQLEHYEIRPPVSWPCCLIDVGDDFNFSDVAGTFKQQADGLIMFRLGMVKYTDSNNLVPANIRENALQYFEIEQKLFVALHGWAPAGFGRLLRRKSTKELREDDILVRRVPFAISFTDESAKPVKTTIARPGINVGINRAAGGEFSDDFNNDFT